MAQIYIDNAKLQLQEPAQPTGIEREKLLGTLQRLSNGRLQLGSSLHSSQLIIQSKETINVLFTVLGKVADSI